MTDSVPTTEKIGWFQWFLNWGYIGRGIGVLCFIIILLFILSIFWSTEPAPFDVEAVAKEYATNHKETIVTGYISTYTLMEIARRGLLDKAGGYLSNDKLPPSVFMDNIPNWEFGVLQQVRDFSQVMRNNFSRSRTGGQENAELATAQPKFNVDNMSWMFPAAESEYRSGINALDKYLHKLTDAKKSEQFSARADSLRLWLDTVTLRLGNLSQRLSSSVGESRLNIELAGDPKGQSTAPQLASSKEKTPWVEIDDVFFEARGTSWALIHLLKAIEFDFKDILESKNATPLLRQAIKELEATQKSVWSPMILNGSEFGLFANHSLVMSSYISRAQAIISELRELMPQG
ncbi:DUF2333 family protein [Beggiatoa leptomitoformis]|uniref:DUF2333 family protein n=1 Tax=Beggiatoa leptomitoformis TaxID=288004 RepID=A0A2N9YJT3_9GAMM|nr:DUF2333 family protein [Beggiatoa leptomitoformis]ALG69371.2 DUF2333 family protein [Beggiatoa leptomitoformis]AUI70695.2 DUF2333 family protein [Beggiatoa leptomitoformis]